MAANEIPHLASHQRPEGIWVYTRGIAMDANAVVINLRYYDKVLTHRAHSSLCLIRLRVVLSTSLTEDIVVGILKRVFDSSFLIARSIKLISEDDRTKCNLILIQLSLMPLFDP